LSTLEQYSYFLAFVFSNQIEFECTANASLYCSHAKQIKLILISLNNKQKSLCQMASTDPRPRRQRVSKEQENDRAAFGSDALD